MGCALLNVELKESPYPVRHALPGLALGELSAIQSQSLIVGVEMNPTLW